MDEKSRDHEVIIGESDNSESPISKEFKRKIFFYTILYTNRNTSDYCCWLLVTLYTGDEEKM